MVHFILSRKQNTAQRKWTRGFHYLIFRSHFGSEEGSFKWLLPKFVLFLEPQEPEVENPRSGTQVPNPYLRLQVAAVKGKRDEPVVGGCHRQPGSGTHRQVWQSILLHGAG